MSYSANARSHGDAAKKIERSSPLKVRPEHHEAFDRVEMPAFEDSMVAHLRSFSPLHSESLGEDGIRDLIRAGMERAEKHGFSKQHTIRFYIETTILLGIDFDTDPQYPWIKSILTDSSIPDETKRADAVHEWLMDFLRVAGGPEREHAKRALTRAREIPFEALPYGSAEFSDNALELMHANHPEKADYLGDEVLRGLIPRAIEEARDHAVLTNLGVSLFLGLMYSIGHGFTGDPKYPWVLNTLNNPSISDPDIRVERLYSKTMTYLGQAIQHHGAA